MSEPEIELAQILDCLQGALPSVFATCAADGTPNVTEVALVQQIDADRVGVPRQLLDDTVANLDSNPFGQALVVSPTTLHQYLLELEYLHTERDGPTFQSIEATLDASAAHAGAPRPPRLRGVDVHRVRGCRALRDDEAAVPPQRRPADVLGPLDEFVSRMADAGDRDAATRAGLDALAELYGIDKAVVFAGEGERLRPVADHGDAGHCAEHGRLRELIEIATLRRRVVSVPNVVGGDPESGAVRSIAAVPLIHRARQVGVLCLASRGAGRLGPGEERLLRIIGTQIAAVLSELAPQTEALAEVDPEPLAVTYYQADDSVFFDDEYVIKGTPGRILWKLLREHEHAGREYFTNRELRLDEQLELPPGNDNLDSRLLSLRRRLGRKPWGVELLRIGRGRLQLCVARSVSLAEVATHGPMRRAPTLPEAGDVPVAA